MLLAVFVPIAGLTAWLWRDQVKRQNDQAFTARAASIGASVTTAVRRMDDLTLAARTLLGSRPGMTDAEFKRWYRSMGVDQRFAGVAGFSYVELVRRRSLVEAVASSLTEFFAPDLMSRRILAWEKHYPWVSPDVLAYFRTRVTRARGDSAEAIDFVVGQATSRAEQERCVDALVRKTEILWHLLDCTFAAYVEPGWGPGGARAT